MSSSKYTNKSVSDSVQNYEFTSKPTKSWRILTFFKNNGLMIKFDLARQSIYLSFIDKSSPSSYQPFNEGFVIKLDFLSLNELLFCFSFEEPAAWDSWREKNNIKYQINISPFKLQSFNLTSKKTIERESYALKLGIYSNKELFKQFILSPYEFQLVKDLFTSFRATIIDQFCLGIPPS